MGKSDWILKGWLEENSDLSAGEARKKSASWDTSASDLSDEAIDLMLESGKSAAQHQVHAVEHHRMAHDAAVAAARDGECLAQDASESPHHHSYRYEISDSWASDSSLDGIAEPRPKTLD